MNTNKLKSLNVLLVFLNYFVGYLFIYPAIAFKITLLINPDAEQCSDFVLFLLYLIPLFITFFLTKDFFIEDLKLFLKHPFKILISTLKQFGWMYLAMIVCNIIVIMIIGAQESNNEQAVLEAFDKSFLTTLFASSIFAPIVEETVFRGCIFGKIRQKHSFVLAALVSAFAFGFIHISDSVLNRDYLDCVYILTYSVLGYIIAYHYEKQKTIVAPMILHFFNNTLATILIFLL